MVPENVPGTSPPVTPAIAGYVVIHFVKVTSTGCPPLACVGTLAPATPDGEVGEKGWPLHAAVKMQMPMAIDARLMVATPFNRSLNRPCKI
jgi:hypothetical protein